MRFEHLSSRVAKVQRGDLSDTERKALRVVRKAGPGGARAADVAVAIKRSRSATQEALICLRKAGLLGLAGKGVSAIWALPEWAEALDDLITEARFARLMAAGEKTKAAKVLAREKEKTYRRNVDTEKDSQPFIHRIIPAHECPPIRIKAPVWVFGL